MELDYPRDPDWRHLEYALQSSAYSGAATTGVAVSTKDLSIPNPRPDLPLLAIEDVATEAVVATRPEPLQAVANALAYRLLDGQTDIDGTAAHMGLGVQGLQLGCARQAPLIETCWHMPAANVPKHYSQRQTIPLPTSPWLWDMKTTPISPTPSNAVPDVRLPSFASRPEAHLTARD